MPSQRPSLRPYCCASTSLLLIRSRIVSFNRGPSAVRIRYAPPPYSIRVSAHRASKTGTETGTRPPRFKNDCHHQSPTVPPTTLTCIKPQSWCSPSHKPPKFEGGVSSPPLQGGGRRGLYPTENIDNGASWLGSYLQDRSTNKTPHRMPRHTPSETSRHFPAPLPTTTARTIARRAHSLIEGRRADYRRYHTAPFDRSAEGTRSTIPRRVTLLFEFGLPSPSCIS